MDWLLGLVGENELRLLLLSVVVVFLVGAITILTSLISIWVNRNVLIKQATMSFILQAESDKELLEAQKKFNELAKAGHIERYAAKDKQAEDEAEQIRRCLNHYELLAVGINSGVIHEGLYRAWFEKGTIHYWTLAWPFIDSLRQSTGKDELYHEFELLKNKFSPPPKPKVEVWHKRLLRRW
ncbi:Uncharacterised protein [Pannonibacter phragmitetus]|uniref:DUF4760 domain-containing protein n=1 Tax=Pannonibacter phragmitetus TaxID=121719 RepID=A0A378ZU11_9HYPH|nr:DUF4760 domain-containing protein [Pannonibacter phragmitetus]SUB00736.1 Uncharacterised protein [Pannonibacter phragmitetus]